MTEVWIDMARVRFWGCNPRVGFVYMYVTNSCPSRSKKFAMSSVRFSRSNQFLAMGVIDALVFVRADTKQR